MKEIVISNIKKRFCVLNDLAESLEDFQYFEKLNVAKCKSVEDHLWCIVGARESYFKAILAGEWKGFSCSLVDNSNKSNFVSALKRTENEFDLIVERANWVTSTEELLASLYEHETMHEGQLIRLIYGLKLEMPSSSKWA